MRLILLFFILLIVSCSHKIIPSKQETKTHYERILDTTITTTADSALIAALLECDSLGRVRIKDLQQKNGNLLTQNAYLQDNLFKVQSQSNTQTRYKEKVIHDTLRVYIEVPKPYPVEKIVYKAQEKKVYKTRWYQNILCWLGAFYIGESLFKIGLNWKQLTLKTIFKILI